MYIGDKSLRKLAAFIRGYEHALIQHNIATDDHFLRGFDRWIRKRFPISHTRSWEEIIIFVGGNDYESVDIFWRLLDQYLEQNNVGRSDSTQNSSSG
jgi:hypothetical protein